jgi:hypothetical protein
VSTARNLLSRAPYRKRSERSPASGSEGAKGRIFISKAVIVLALAKENRDADHLQNFRGRAAGVEAASAGVV